MSSVTGRIEQVKQPWGGFINPHDFKVVNLKDGFELFNDSNIDPQSTGLVVDYLSRFIITKKPRKAFEISYMGAVNARRVSDALWLMSNVKGNDDISIINVCKLVTFDVWYRNPFNAKDRDLYKKVNPNAHAILNIKIMVKRVLDFIEKFGPITEDGFNFFPEGKKKKFVPDSNGNCGGYSRVVNTGDGDFLTKDTLWDFKVSSYEPTSKITLQLLMYYVMGKHSKRKVFEKIDKIGIFNPKLNKIYTFDVSKLDHKIIEIIEKEVICY